MVSVFIYSIIFLFSTEKWTCFISWMRISSRLLATVRLIFPLSGVVYFYFAAKLRLYETSFKQEYNNPFVPLNRSYTGETNSWLRLCSFSQDLRTTDVQCNSLCIIWQHWVDRCRLIPSGVPDSHTLSSLLSSNGVSILGSPHECHCLFSS